MHLHHFSHTLSKTFFRSFRIRNTQLTTNAVTMASPPTASDSATRFGQLSLTHSQLKSKLQLHRESSTYGRRAVQEPRTEPDPPTEPWAVVPHQGYDVAFASLRMVVYQIDRTSAAHVAQEIRDKFSDAEVLELINGFTASHLMAVSKKPHQSRTKLFAFDEEQRPARLGALSKAIEEGRGRHAEWLRDRHMVDVDIMYKCAEYALVHNITLRSDKDKMAAEVSQEAWGWYLLLAHLLPREASLTIYIRSHTTTSTGREWR